LLGPAVDILLALGDLQAARDAAEELSAIADAFDSPALRASATQAAGATAMAAGQLDVAVGLYGDARALWQDIGAPYEVARLRAQLGHAYQQMGDVEGARLEFEAAHETFERIGAAPEVSRLASLVAHRASPAGGPLTGREVEVLRLVAAGKTNRRIATELSISEKTVARHLSNIFTKLDLPSRSAATAYAYEHKLV
jgi:DNA-binding CsgD family transcriptional regulator